jgi:hypothetical protein
LNAKFRTLTIPQIVKRRHRPMFAVLHEPMSVP